MVNGSKENDSMLRISFNCYTIYPSLIIIVTFLTLCPMISDTTKASTTFSNEVSSSTRISDQPTRLDKLEIPRNRSTSSLASSAFTGPKLVINTNQPTRLSFHEGTVSDLDGVTR